MKLEACLGPRWAVIFLNLILSWRHLTERNLNLLIREYDDVIIPLYLFILLITYFLTPLANTVQQIENHGNKHWAHYAGLVESGER